MSQPFEQPSPKGGPVLPAEEPRGLIVVDKPQGITSRRALNIVEQRLGLGPLGHCGSLDPLATGVLVLVVGKARKVQDLIVRGEKVYDMTVTLGARSDTDDAEGEVTPVEGVQPSAREAVEAALQPFRGEISQVPPTYSAVKVDGRRMHREARKGRPVEAPPRTVTVHELRLDRYEWPELDLHLRCTSGTYARGIARDLGAALGTGGYMSRLVRTSVGALDLSQAVPPERVEAAHVTGIEPALREFPRINVPLQQRNRLVRGQTLRTPPGFVPADPCFAWCEGEVLASVTFVEGGSAFRTKKLLV
ncbi:MAG TPA: tRNA pseudouridine(55) synthase TruB [Planctomycetota bacterium]|nr:tRNA pseudouridine(55) synthase TruB [Planctomycetota bacterium]